MPTSLTEFDEDTAFERYVLDRATPLLPRSQGTSGEQLGRYRLGGDVAVQPEDGGAISVADYALGFVDLIEKGDHRRAQVNLGH